MTNTAEEILKLAHRAEVEIAAAASLQDLDGVRVAYLGREGRVTVALRGLGQLPAEQRPAAGAAANQARARTESALAERHRQLQAEAEARAAAGEYLDVTLPGRSPEVGHRHPLMMTLEQICDVFIGMGYEVATGPEAEWYDLNWTALNYPPDHPAMDEQDSFYVTDRIMLRTHTSPGQIRAMRARHAEACPVRHLEWRTPPMDTLSHCRCTPAPTRVVIPGRTYRRESVTLTHNDIFYQLECLLVDEGITFADLKGTMTTFVHEYFGPAIPVRFRPDFFPFTEPSADFSVGCDRCMGSGCRFCKDSGWVEIGGSGLVHPHVLIAGGYDPEKVSGFAFGFGIDRLAQRRYNIEHIRTLYENDMRFLKQF
ncbi:MAG: phenylalanine--tRNA ligase subunit alpha [Armatimonadota bacterium]|jgi:phenylalanyl-tRNA synthetase alpha chain